MGQRQRQKSVLEVLIRARSSCISRPLFLFILMVDAESLFCTQRSPADVGITPTCLTEAASGLNQG